MRDRGANDFKVLGVPSRDPLLDEYRTLSDVPAHFLREVEHFFLTYKQLEGVTVESGGWSDADAAVAEVDACVERFTRGLPDPDTE